MARPTQEELLEIFNAVQQEMKPYEKGTIKARIDIQGKYDLWSEKKGIIAVGKQRDEMSFTTAILQSSYVGFYYMPVYCDPSIKDQLAPELAKCLKGKACFHIKTADKEMMLHIRKAMKIGYELYEKLGWV